MLKSQIHRKTVSNNPKTSETTKYNSLQSGTKLANSKPTSQEYLQVLKKLIAVQNKSSNNSKTRIRTEGNEKLRIQNSSQKLKQLPSIGKSEQSQSPPQRNSNVNVITDLLYQNMNEHKRISRDQRNQSADFQAIICKQDNRNWKNNKKKFNSYGNLNDQVYFSQRNGLPECQYAIQQPIIEMGLKGSSSMKQFGSQQFLTTQEFKEKLSNLSREVKNKQRQSEEDINNIEIQKTLKKQYKSCNRYENADSDHRSKSLESSRDEKQENYIKTNKGYIEQKKLENKIDQLVFQVQILKKKSEQLELQNKVLFENLSKFQADSDCSADDRNLLMNKLDQMIIMQKRQEDNLNFFKQYFTKPNDQSRRIKTEQQQLLEERAKISQKIEVSKQRPFVKSAYQIKDFNI